MKKSLVKNSLYNIVYKLVSAVYPLVAVTYVSHILMSNNMGIVSYSQNIVSYFAVFAALGIPTYGVKGTAIRSKEKSERSQFFWELFTINFISTTLAIIAYIILIFNITKFHNYLTLYLVAGLQILFNYLNVDWFYQGLEEYEYIAKRSIIVKLLALIALPIFIHTPDDYIWYAMIYCLAIGGNNIFNIIKIRQYIQKPTQKIQIKKHLKPISTLLIVSVAVEIYVMIDTTMLGIFTNDSVVGCYSNAMKLIRMVSAMAAAIGAVLFPRLSIVFNKKDEKNFSNLINTGLKIMLMIAFPIMIGLIVCSHDIILILFGSSFADAIPILRILAIMTPVIVCNTLMGGQVLVTTNQENKYVLTVVIASVVNIILNALLIPKYGATSAAFASLISECIDLTLYTLFAKKYVKLKFSMNYLLSMIIPLIIYVLISKFIIAKIFVNMYYSLCANIIICGCIYFGIGYIMKNEAIIFSLNKIKGLFNQKNTVKES